MKAGSSERSSKQNRFFTKKSVLVVLFTLYITFIFLSQIPFLAEDLIDTSAMDDKYEYNLSFPTDGRLGHYYVERYDTSKVGRINVEYTTSSNSLVVDCSNIKILWIYCRDMYEDKSEEVLKRDPKLDSNYYKTYFIERDHFSVHVNTEKMIAELSFIDTPVPYNVTVNGQEWWLTNVNYTYENDGIVLTKVPTGHSYVDIYFKSNDLNAPNAQFSVSKSVVGVGESIILNATASSDPDGEIISYVWDLGNGIYKGSVTTNYAYTQEGTFRVILTVTDDNYLVDRAFENIIVVQRVMGVSINVDKPIATPGSVLTYSITPTINSSWQAGVKDLTIINALPDELNYMDASPLPTLSDNTVIWELGLVFSADELPIITLQVVITDNVKDDSIISNYVRMDYSRIDDQTFPQELSNSVKTRVNVNTILAPSIREQVHDIELEEDAPPYDLQLGSYEYDLQDVGTDLNWYLTDENESIYLISGEYSANDIITITPISNAYGDSLVNLWLVDSEGYTTNQPLWINITPVNDNPVFHKAPDLIIHSGEPYTFDYEPYLSDIDSPKEQLQLLASEKTEGIDSGISISRANAFDHSGSNIAGSQGGSRSTYFQIDMFKVTYNYPESYMDQKVFISLIVFDGSGSDSDTIQINVTDDYTPVLKKALPDIWLVEGETKVNLFDIDEYFEDPDKDSLFYSFGETHVSVTINANHTVDISAPNDWNGIDTVTFRARDPIGAIAEDTIVVIVTPINDPPVITGVPDTFLVHYDSDYSFDLTPYIHDEDNTHDELFLILNDEHIRVDPLNQLKIIMNYPRAMVDLEIPLTLTVSDGIDTSFQLVKVKVTDNWPPEIVNEIMDISFYEDDILINAFNLNDFFDDKDSITLYFSYGHKDVKININLDGSVDFSSAPDWYGMEIVTFRATDSTDAFVECVITVTVNPVNDPPIIHPLPAQYSVVKELYKFDLSDYIYDVDNNISELKITAESDVLDVSISGRELLIYSTEAITESVKVTVSDGLSETYADVFVEVQKKEVNDSDKEENIMSLLWLILLIIIIVVIITGIVARRRYVGNYNIEEIFCIYNNGILIKHETSKSSKHSADEFVVSGMLTAILNFTQDAFNETDEGEIDGEGNKTAWGIKEIQMNEKNILVERGNYVFLATVFSGRSGKKLYSESRRVLNTIESKYNKKLQTWKGSVKELAGTKDIIRSMLTEEKNNHNNKKNNNNNNNNNNFHPERK